MRTNPRPTTPKHQKRFDEIVAAAAVVFHRKGYDAATLDEVAERLGVRKAALYRYVGGKEELLYVIIERALRGLTETNTRWRSVPGGPLEQIRVFLADHASLLIDHLPELSVCFADMRCLPPDRQATLQALAEEYRKLLEGLVRDAHAAGLTDQATNPVLAAHGMFGIVNYLHRWYRPGRGIARSKIVTSLPEIAVASLAPKSPR